jgi:hypothetical protein
MARMRVQRHARAPGEGAFIARISPGIHAWLATVRAPLAHSMEAS